MRSQSAFVGVHSPEDRTSVAVSANLGAAFFGEDGYSPVTYACFAPARVKDHGLVCETADHFSLSFCLIKGICHHDAYSLF